MSVHPDFARFAAHGARLKETLELPVVRLCLGLTAVVGALSAIGIAAAPFHLVLKNFYALPWALTVLAATIVLQMGVLMRLDGDASWPAQTIVAVCRRLGDVCALGMVAIVFFCCAHLLQALAACVGFAWQDDLLSEETVRSASSGSHSLPPSMLIPPWSRR